MVFDDGWVGLQWFEYVFDVGVVGQVVVFVDLCVGIDGGLGIDYCVFIYVGVDVGEVWYQYYVFVEVGVVVCDGVWYYVYVGMVEFGFIEVGEV